jgi:hypothetical protein
MKRLTLLVAVGATAFAAAQSPRSRGKAPGGISWAAMDYNGLGVVTLLEAPEVQRELEFEDKDRANVPLLRDELRDRHKTFDHALRDAVENRDAFVQKLVQHSKDIDRELEAVLGARFIRFKEIRRQAFGVQAAATADAEVREGFAMTEDQRLTLNRLRKEKLDKIIEDVAKEQGSTKVRQSVLDEAARRFALIEEDIFKKTLNDRQNAKWKDLAGEPFTIPDAVVRSIRQGSHDGSKSDRRVRRESSGKRKKEKGSNPPPQVAKDGKKP